MAKEYEELFKLRSEVDKLLDSVKDTLNYVLLFFLCAYTAIDWMNRQVMIASVFASDKTVRNYL